MISYLFATKKNGSRKPKMFWLAFVVFMLACLFFLMDHFRSYESEVKLLMTPKTEKASVTRVQAMSDLSDFPKLLSFYERFLLDNPQFKDLWSGQQPDQRKSKWNKIISTEVGEGTNTGLLTVRAKASDRETAIAISEGAARSLYGYASRFYDLKVDYKLELIDGPIAKAVIDDLWLVILWSLLGGYALAASFFWLVEDFLFGLGGGVRKLTRFNYGKIIQSGKAEKFMSVAAETEEYDLEKALGLKEKPGEPVSPAESEHSQKPIGDLEKIHEKKKSEAYPNFPEMPQKNVNGNAPDNLPIAEAPTQDFGFGGSSIIDEHTEKGAEPSQEEYKQRLNDLLKGRS